MYKRYLKYSPTESKDIPELITVPFLKDKYGQRYRSTGMSCNGCTVFQCQGGKNNTLLVFDPKREKINSQESKINIPTKKQC